MKLIMDEVFGEERFINEIIWKRSNPHNDTKKYGSIHDLIFLYSRRSNYVFNVHMEALPDEYVASR